MIMRLLALLICFGALAPVPAARSQPAPQRIVAIGDLHGDFEAWRAIARDARIIDQRGRWSGGAATLVQTGDIVDRGPDSLKIIQDLMRLQKQARTSGGSVIVLNGNHEAMTITGDLRYVDPGEYRAFVTQRSAAVREAAYQDQRAIVEATAKARDPSLTDAAIRSAWMAQVPLGFIERRRAWSSSGRLGKWAVANPAVVRIGDTLFVHGGISADYATMPIEEINRRVAQALAAQSSGEDSIINDPRGPLWYRGLVTRVGLEERSTTPKPPPPRPSIEQELDQVLTAFQVRRMVIGHTPSLKGIAVDHGGKLIRIDTGISRTYGGTLSWLEISGDRVVPRSVQRPSAGVS